MFNALVGTPSDVSRLNMYVCDIEGNADAKSKSTRAPVLVVRAVVMAAKSMSSTFLRMDLCCRNPCC